MSDLDIIKSWQQYKGQTLEDGDILLIDDGEEGRVVGSQIITKDVIYEINEGIEEDGAIRDPESEVILAQIQAYKKPGFIGKSKTIKKINDKRD